MDKSIKSEILKQVNEEIATTPNDDGSFTVQVNPTRAEFYSIMKNSKFLILRGIITQQNLFLWDAFLADHDYAFSTKIKNNIGLTSNKHFDVDTIEARILIKDEDDGVFIVEIDNFTDSSKTNPREITDDDVKKILLPILGEPRNNLKDVDYNYLIYEEK